MNPVHETLLQDFLRDVWTYGSDRLSYRLLNRWFKAERITKRIWLAILANFETIREEVGDTDGYQLGYLETDRADCITFIVLDPADAVTSYMKPVAEIAGV